MYEKIMKNKVLLFGSIFIILFSVGGVLAGDKISAEEVINKHLESIGSKAKRTEKTSQMLTADVQFSYKGSPTAVNGNAVFASEGEKNIWGILLNSNDYPQDKFGYNGEKTQVAFTKPGSYSVLGDFILSYKNILKEGLLGGVLFSSWSLNDVQNRKAKISFAGTKKIDSTEAYVIEYSPKSSTDLEIKMFFDKNNFHHLRTEFFKLIAARQASKIEDSAGQSSDRFQVIEDFSEFQDMGGLTLPSKYKISYSYYNNSPNQASKRKTLEVEWNFNIKAFSYNQKFESNAFQIDSN